MTEGTPSAPARLELPARIASGVVLAAAALAGLVAGGLGFSAVVALVAILGLLEWHRLVNGGHIAVEMVPSSLGVIVVAWFARSPNGVDTAVFAIVAAAAATGLLALRRLPLLWPLPWQGFGAIYLGIPALALVVLRNSPEGVVLVGSIFVAVWSADTGALFIGRALGGPKLAPVLSPNKTWSGFIGGTLAAGVAEAVYAALFEGRVGEGFLFGLVLALAGHSGDLFESWVKRRFHAKNMGRLIPGHGGMLDRIDSLLFAAPLCALLIELAGFDPFGGAR